MNHPDGEAEPSGEGRDDRDFLETSGIDPTSFETPVVAASGDEVASIALRALARGIDFMVIALIGLAIVTPMTDTSADEASIPVLARILAVLGWLFYEAATTAWLGQTMGKLAMRIKVVDVATGAKPAFSKAVIRAAVVPGLIAVMAQFALFALLAYSTAAGDRHMHRGLLDRLAGTAVVRAIPPGGGRS